MKGLVFLLFAALASGAYFDGTANDEAGYHFIGKFAFDTGQPSGEIDIKLEVEDWTPEKFNKYQNYEVWLFDDEEDAWPAIYQKGLGCSEIRTKAKNYNKDLQDINANLKIAFDSNGKYTAKAGIGQKVRQRNWFVVLANCKDASGVHNVENVKYSTHFTNINRSWWNREFGANQAGMQTLYLCFSMIYLPFMCIHFIGVAELSTKLEYVHPMVKLFAVVVFLQSVTILSNLAFWGAFVQNGKGLAVALPLAELVDCLTRTIFILILMLMAKGWTISGDELNGKWFVVMVVGGFFVGDALVITWRFLVADPAAVVPDLGVTIFLYIILLVWLVLATWFAKTLIDSWRKEDNPVKRTLYRNLAIVYLPWFFGLPLVTLLTLQLSPWVAERIVKTVSLLISTAGYMVLSYLLWPSRAEEYFNISTPDVMKAQIDTYEQL